MSVQCATTCCTCQFDGQQCQSVILRVTYVMQELCLPLLHARGPQSRIFVRVSCLQMTEDGMRRHSVIALLWWEHFTNQSLSEQVVLGRFYLSTIEWNTYVRNHRHPWIIQNGHLVQHPWVHCHSRPHWHVLVHGHGYLATRGCVQNLSSVPWKCCGGWQCGVQCRGISWSCCISDSEFELLHPGISSV